MMVENEKIPWYSLNPRQLHFGKWTWRFIKVAAVIFVLSAFSVKPLWQFGWRAHLYCPEQFFPVKSAKGKSFRGGDWVTSKKIIVYGAPGTNDALVYETAEGLRNIVDELHLDISVQLVPCPKDAEYSLIAATHPHGQVASQPTAHKWIMTGKAISRFDLDTFIAHRLDARGMKFAEMVVVDAQFTNPDWAWGLTDFPSGTAVLQQGETGRELARHEGTHLLGYDRHDDFPYYVFGYPEGWLPSQRATLMMLLTKDTPQLSPRAHDAVINFWRGLETKKRRYFK